jgi:hypothetical protein
MDFDCPWTANVIFARCAKSELNEQYTYLRCSTEESAPAKKQVNDYSISNIFF